MKKIFHLPFTFVFVAILVCTALLLSACNTKAATFVLIKEGGRVQYKTGSDYQDMDKDQMELPSGTFIKTYDNGAQILMPDNSLISMDADTEVQVKFEGASTDLVQIAGSTWNRVEKLTSGNGFKVETPTVIAAVRGTEFGVLVPGSEQSDIFVTDSNVKVGKIKQTDQGSDFADTNDLATGQWYKYDRGETQIQEIPQQIYQSNWYKKNILLNEKLKDLDKTKLKDQLTTILGGLDSELDTNVLGETTGVPGLPNYLYDFGQICSTVITENFIQYKSVIDQKIAMLPAFAPQLKFTKDYLDLMVNSCADGIVDETELLQLQQLSKTMQEQSTTPQVP